MGLEAEGGSQFLLKYQPVIEDFAKSIGSSILRFVLMFRDPRLNVDKVQLYHFARCPAGTGNDYRFPRRIVILVGYNSGFTLGRVLFHCLAGHT